jgi:hypothetical protein
MDDEHVDVAIIEASALLITLIFIILSFYSANYAMYYTTWQQRCTSNPQECAWPPWLAALSAQVGTLEPHTYAVGFFFVVAAMAATVRLFMTDSTWQKAGLQVIELSFFLMGLVALAYVFFFRALRGVYTLGFIVLVTLGMIAGPLWWAHHRRRVIEAGGST